MSTIKVDTIQKANGTSQIGIDKIGGVAAAGTIAVIAEGGTNTTNLAQGLCKVWCLLDGTGTIGVTDSFNIASATDNGTGDYTTTATNAFGNSTYACCATSGQNSGDQVSAMNQAGARSTTAIRTQCVRSTSDSFLDCDFVETIRMGDLA